MLMTFQEIAEETKVSLPQVRRWASFGTQSEASEAGRI